MSFFGLFHRAPHAHPRQRRAAVATPGPAKKPSFARFEREDPFLSIRRRKSSAAVEVEGLRRGSSRAGQMRAQIVGRSSRPAG